MAATYDTVRALVDIALKYFRQNCPTSSDEGWEVKELQAMLVEMNTVAQAQPNKSVRETFRRMLDEVSKRLPPPAPKPVPRTLRERIASIYPDEQISVERMPWHTLDKGAVVFAGSLGNIIAFCTDRRIANSDRAGEWYWVETAWNPGGDLVKVERKYLGE